MVFQIDASVFFSWFWNDLEQPESLYSQSSKIKLSEMNFFPKKLSPSMWRCSAFAISKFGQTGSFVVPKN